VGLGYNPFKQLIICTGGGRNGKTTLFEILKAALGEGLVAFVSYHAVTTGNDNLSMSCRYRLRGSAIAVIDETPTKKWDEETIKLLSGAETITVKQLYKKPENIPVTFIVVILTNDLPTNFKSQNFALADRIVCIKFPFRFVDNVTTSMNGVKPKDEAKVAAMKKNTPSIIAALRKHFKLAAEKNFKLQLSDSIKEITEPIRLVANAISYFLSECVEDDPDAVIKGTELYEAYKVYCKNKEVKAISYKKFNTQLRLQNYRTMHKRDGVYFVGIKLKDNWNGNGSGGLFSNEESEEDDDIVMRAITSTDEDEDNDFPF